VADLEVRDGIVATRPLIIDTAIADLGGEGTIDLESETIDIALTAQPDETPLPTDLTGISITGTLAEPKLAINPLALAARGAAAATLGLLLKPFTALAGAATDEQEPSCAALLDAPSASESDG
jgi:AsmA family protein